MMVHRLQLLSWEPMERTQISLDPRQLEELRGLAADRGVSMAALVREAVDRLVDDARRRRARQRMLESAGYAGGAQGQPVGRDHDTHLVDAYGTR